MQTVILALENINSDTSWDTRSAETDKSKGLEAMHKIAILSDIHGNVTALEAALKDAILAEVTDYWILGDLTMPGPGSSDLLKRLRNLPNVVFVKGNWEDFFLNTSAFDFDRPTDVYGARLAKYQLDHLSEEELAFIEELPQIVIKEVAGFEFLICHHLPHKNYGGDLWISEKQENFDLLFADHKSDVAVFGHSHHQLMRYSSEGQLILNPGSIYQSFFFWENFKNNVSRAQYTIIEVDQNGIGNINFKKVDYDTKKEIALAKARNLPYFELYKDALETGRSYTHNKEVLEKVNAEHGYKEEVVKFFKR